MKSVNEDKKTLALFQCEFNRSLEEDFAQIITERSDVRLFFVNENQAFTDGRNIIVDPAWRGLFADVPALIETEQYLKLDHSISNDRWLALRMITRAQNIHEALHIIYSNFPGGAARDPRGATKVRKLVLSLIANIIEDAFIEAAGCSVYDNLERFLLWNRVAMCCANIPSQGTIERAFSALPKQEERETSQRVLIADYLEYMARFLLYPMVKQSDPDEALATYVERTKRLFSDGCMCGAADKRYLYTQQIFDIIEPLLTEDENVSSERLELMLPGMKTHSPLSSSIKTWDSAGRNAAVTRRLFTDENGRPIVFDRLNKLIVSELVRFQEEKEAAIKIVTYPGTFDKISGVGFDCAKIHEGIIIEVAKPRINLNLKRAYQNIYNRYHINISSYNARFSQLLKGTVDLREEKQLFGAGIASKRLGDVKKRYWYRTVKGTGVPDIALLLMIDGSGSMSGERRECAIISSVILHEVLCKNNIAHAIVEHRAIYDEPTLRHNILVDFNASDEEKYNLLTLQADEGTREGLSLFWAEKYLLNNVCENRIIIMISDGVPAHGIDSDACYLPPVSIKDTANAVRKISKRGTQIIAIALDSPAEDSCYRALTEIYPQVISCTELKRLTGQLLELISELLQ